MTRLGSTIVTVARTVPLGGGWRSVWYLPNGTTVHAIEDRPIPAGTYFLRPDDTGKFKNWVIECELGTGVAVPTRGTLVPPRKHVEIHAGNTLEHTEGCACPGLEVSPNGVAHSKAAVKDMRLALHRDGEDPPVWILRITEPGG